jgi:hypothetical protein
MTDARPDFADPRCLKKASSGSVSGILEPSGERCKAMR